MQEEYILPSKHYADFIISDGGFNQSAIDVLAKMIKERIKL